MNKDLYFKSGCSICPKCESSDISSGHVAVDTDYAYALVYCNECNFEWKDIYRLVDIEAA